MIPDPLKKIEHGDERFSQARLKSLDDHIEIQYEGPELNFFGMRDHRKPVDPELIAQNMKGEGHLFANVGVSLILETMIDNQNYAIAVKQPRAEFGDSAVKLISGYHVLQKGSLMDAAICELDEILVYDPIEDKLIAGTFQGETLPEHFSDKMGYSDDLFYFAELDPSPAPYVRGLHHLQTEIDGNKAFVNILSTLNCAQFIPKLTLTLPNYPVSLIQAEDRTDTSCVHPYEEGLVLLQLENGKLTGESFHYLEGKLIPIGNPHFQTLSEAFVETDESGIVNQNNIGFGKYLEK